MKSSLTSNTPILVTSRLALLGLCLTLLWLIPSVAADGSSKSTITNNQSLQCNNSLTIQRDWGFRQFELPLAERGGADRLLSVKSSNVAQKNNISFINPAGIEGIENELHIQVSHQPDLRDPQQLQIEYQGEIYGIEVMKPNKPRYIPQLTKSKQAVVTTKASSKISQPVYISVSTTAGIMAYQVIGKTPERIPLKFLPLNLLENQEHWRIDEVRVTQDGMPASARLWFGLKDHKPLRNTIAEESASISVGALQPLMDYLQVDKVEDLAGYEFRTPSHLQYKFKGLTSRAFEYHLSLFKFGSPDNYNPPTGEEISEYILAEFLAERVPVFGNWFDKLALENTLVEVFRNREWLNLLVDRVASESGGKLKLTVLSTEFRGRFAFSKGIAMSLERQGQTPKIIIFNPNQTVGPFRALTSDEKYTIPKGW